MIIEFVKMIKRKKVGPGSRASLEERDVDFVANFEGLDDRRGDGVGLYTSMPLGLSEVETPTLRD